MGNYFDYAATCPIDSDALEAYVHASKEFYGNTSSLHDEGSKAASLLEHCREQLATLLNVDKEGLYFTSGGTESNEIAIYSLLSAKKGGHIIASHAEHSSVQNILNKLEREGYDVTRIPLTPSGKVNVKLVGEAVRRDTACIAVQHVNSDIGTIQPIEEIAALCRSQGILFHSDCVQSFGKIDLSKISSSVDSFSVSSHKVYGPKGIGAVYLNPSLSFNPRVPGTTHERGVRPGTLHLAGIAGFAVAAEKMAAKMDDHQSKIIQLKNVFFRAMTIKGWELIGDTSTNPIPITGLCLNEREGQWAMLEGNRRGFYFSTGSACSVQSHQPPVTLMAMGRKKEEADSFIRVSFSHKQTIKDVRALGVFLNSIIQAVPSS
ncbi:IscS subfamily cysteine desulfurase [Halobacillus litoralis]|uniref:IscS subfamily cysteine desulfurase n=1 Tax=Halobacillus litoralis TaxID=45668 RepID=UPI001CFEE35E|nr:IscS subfamily cysteine desulfurase [Halobacillus litoralis]